MKEKGKVAVVTGASSGIGRAIAERLGKSGASVVVNYQENPQPADEIVEFISRGGGTAIAVKADVADSAQLRGLIDIAESEFGGLDIFVSNAADYRLGSLTESTEEDFDAVFATNTRAGFVALHESAIRMRSGGRVVVISAGLTRIPREGTGLYAASKAALDHLVRVAAHEMGPKGITVNSVLPGAVNTAATATVPAELIAAEIANTPLGRIGEPADIADVVAFLVSDEARWITGQLIGAGGGMF